MSALGESTSPSAVLVGIIEINPGEIQEIERTKSGKPLMILASFILATIPLSVSSIRVPRIKQGRLLLVLAVCFCSSDSFLLHSGTRRSAFRRGRNFYFIITAVRVLRGLARTLQEERKGKRERERERGRGYTQQKRSSSSASRTFSLVYRQVPTSDWFRLDGRTRVRTQCT